jgi:hypothetical protein
MHGRAKWLPRDPTPWCHRVTATPTGGRKRRRSAALVQADPVDTVYARPRSAGLRAVQTTLVPAGDAAIVDLKMDVCPAASCSSTHSISRAMDKGPLGIIEAAGPEQPQIFKVLTGGSSASGGH